MSARGNGPRAGSGSPPGEAEAAKEQHGSQPPFVVSPGVGAAPRNPSRLPMAGGTELSERTVRIMRERGVANPDDPPVEQPLHGVRGPLTGPDEPNLPGRIAIVQGQVYIVGVILITQLFLVTTALYELLSGRSDILPWIAVASLVGFLVALVVAIWPSRRVRGM